MSSPSSSSVSPAPARSMVRQSSWLTDEGDVPQQTQHAEKVVEGGENVGSVFEMLSLRICNTSWLSGRRRTQIREFMGSQWVVLLTLGATIVTLYLSDVAILATTQESDRWVTLTLAVFLLWFVGELVLNSLGRRGFFLSFFFFLDFVATASIAVSLDWGLLFTGVEECGDEDDVFVSQAGRTVRIVRQGGRALRVIRALRFVTIIRTFNVILRWAQGKEEVDDDELEHDAIGAEKKGQAGKIGSHLTYLASRRVVYIIITLSILLPFALDMSATTSTRSAIFAMLLSLSSRTDTTQAAVESTLESAAALSGVTPLFARLNGTVYVNEGHGSDLRCSEKEWYRGDAGSAVLFAVTAEAREAALFNILFISLSLLILFISMILFSQDARRFVVEPLVRTSRILSNLRAKIASSVRGFDAVEWETGLVEEEILHLAQWVEAQQSRGLLREDTPKDDGGNDTGVSVERSEEERSGKSGKSGKSGEGVEDSTKGESKHFSPFHIPPMSRSASVRAGSALRGGDWGSSSALDIPKHAVVPKDEESGVGIGQRRRRVGSEESTSPTRLRPPQPRLRKHHSHIVPPRLRRFKSSFAPEELRAAEHSSSAHYRSRRHIFVDTSSSTTSTTNSSGLATTPAAVSNAFDPDACLPFDPNGPLSWLNDRERTIAPSEEVVQEEEEEEGDEGNEGDEGGGEGKDGGN